MRVTTKSRATEVLRRMFGPLARFSRVDRGGLAGIQVDAPVGIVYRTFDLSGDVWRRCVVAAIPAWRQGRRAVRR